MGPGIEGKSIPLGHQPSPCPSLHSQSRTWSSSCCRNVSEGSRGPCSSWWPHSTPRPFLHRLWWEACPGRGQRVALLPSLSNLWAVMPPSSKHVGRVQESRSVWRIHHLPVPRPPVDVHQVGVHDHLQKNRPPRALGCVVSTHPAGSSPGPLFVPSLLCPIQTGRQIVDGHPPPGSTKGLQPAQHLLVPNQVQRIWGNACPTWSGASLRPTSPESSLHPWYPAQPQVAPQGLKRPSLRERQPQHWLPQQPPLVQTFLPPQMGHSSHHEGQQLLPCPFLP